MKSPAEELSEEIVAVLAPFFPDLDLARVRIHHGIPFYVRGNPIGYTDRYRIYLDHGAYRVDTIDGIALLAHEIVHTRQYRDYGTWTFRLLYFYFYAMNLLRGMSRKEAYLNVPFEIEAREVEARVHLAMKRFQESINL